MPRRKGQPKPIVSAIRQGVPIPPKAPRGVGKHTSKVLRKARYAFDAGQHATLDEAVDEFYEECSGRKVSDEVTEADVDRRNRYKQRMRAKLRGMASKEPDEGT
ncbi:hypothetical protein [Rhodophyticola porphyridii]|uniref:hypothetical protein n=1 Tax=Rhodophyticola porphyridii TaxID=1852017 RepID=UPI0011C35D2B|nr:hypothetical protein [Rhodophyticola porphyridii]